MLLTRVVLYEFTPPNPFIRDSWCKNSGHLSRIMSAYVHLPCPFLSLGIGSRFGWSWVSMFLSFSWNLSANERAEAQQSVSAGTSILEAPTLRSCFTLLSNLHLAPCVLPLDRTKVHYNRSCHDSAILRFERNERQATVLSAR